MASHPALAVLLVLSAALVSTCAGGKVLVYPLDGSHWLNMKILVELLHSRGHQISVIRSSTSWYIPEVSSHYTSITVPLEHSQIIESQDSMTSFLKEALDIRRREGSPWAFFEFYQQLYGILEQSQRDISKMLTSIFEDETLSRKLKETKYDLMLTDPAFPGGVLLAHYLQLPVVFNARWSFSSDAQFIIAPSPLSYVPQMFSYNTDRMDFFQRMENVIAHIMLVYMHYYVVTPPYQALCGRYFGPEVSVLSLMQGADLWLVRSDFVFDFPRPTMPNVVYIGGFQGKPSKALPADLEEFVQSSGDHGVVLMSLGTLLGDLGPELSEVFASAFASLPQKVVWRHIGARPSSLGNNTLLVKWLPQNDMLGHPKTKLFISHGGTNGIYEAIYHGVPILGVPLIFDQVDNFVRLKARGAAETVDVTRVDAASLSQTLRKILHPANSYRDRMKKLSQLHHDKPMKPLDSALFWLEFVMRHRGAAHLRTESYRLAWYAYHCLDVMAVFAAVGLLLLLLLWASCRCLCRALSTKSAPKSKKE